jgi:hypothetical protein
MFLAASAATWGEIRGRERRSLGGEAALAVMLSNLLFGISADFLMLFFQIIGLGVK